MGIEPEIIVQLAPEAAAAMARGEPTLETRCIREALDELRVSMRPLHPGVEAGRLAAFFLVVAPGGTKREVDAIVERLSACPGVKAAYSKPPARPAGPRPGGAAWRPS